MTYKEKRWEGQFAQSGLSSLSGPSGQFRQRVKESKSRSGLSGWFRGFGAKVFYQAGDYLRSPFGLAINLTETAFINVPLIESHNKTLALKLLWQAGLFKNCISSVP
jgi:hypothetical protein